MVLYLQFVSKNIKHCVSANLTSGNHYKKFMILSSKLTFIHKFARLRLSAHFLSLMSTSVLKSL